MSKKVGIMPTGYINKIKNNFRKEQLLEILSDLIRVPSENPPGDESKISQVAIKWLKKFGFFIETHSAKKKRINIIATKTWDKRGRTLIWSGHMDVVPAGDIGLWHNAPYEPRVIKNRIYGRGSTDMKGGIAAAIEAVATLIKAGITPKGRLTFLLSADEETSAVFGTDYLTAKGILNTKSGDAAIVGEPTELDVLIAEKGYVWIRISTTGKPAHGSRPELGINAIEKMSKIITKLSAIKLKGIHPILGSPTINIGTIDGGTKINVVPDRCSITIDRRTIPQEVDTEVVKKFETAIEELKKIDEDLNATVEIYDRADPSEISKDEEIVRLALESIREVTGKSNIGGLSGASDARFLINRCRIPTIICGPGSLKQAHVANEYVDVNQLTNASYIYALIIAEFLS